MGNKWNDIEIEMLRNIYQITDDTNVINYFSGRTLTSIKVKAKRLKLYRNNGIKKSNKSNATTGTKNGMFRKIPHNKGVSPNDDVKTKIRGGIFNYWNNLSETDLKKRKNKLRKDWIIKRDRYSEIDTLPEKIIESLLIKLNLKYQKKINIGYYNCDFIINENIVEVQGDYWHGNPKFYNIFDRIQEKNIKRDKRKLEYLQSKGFKVIFLWENDLKSNLDYCEELLIKELL